jgi:hypothetical protein
MATREPRQAVKGPSPWKIALPARWLVYSVAPLVWLLISTPAHATAIGVFNWSEYTQDECDAGLCGAFFFVENFSTDPDFSLGALGDTFFDVSVDLQTDGGPMSLLLNDIAPGDSSQSIDDLSATTIATAALTLTFGLPGSIQLLDELGNEVTALMAPGSLLIDFAASEPPAPVPEPSTLLLLIAGVSVLSRARRARPKRLAVIPAGPLQHSGESR